MLILDPCTACDSTEATFLGTLGPVTWARCRHCGIDRIVPDLFDDDDDLVVDDAPTHEPPRAVLVAWRNTLAGWGVPCSAEDVGFAFHHAFDSKRTASGEDYVVVFFKSDKPGLDPIDGWRSWLDTSDREALVQGLLDLGLVEYASNPF